MSPQPPNPFQSPEVLKRLLYTFICISAYIVGRNVPIPGLHPDYLAAIYDGDLDAKIRAVSIFSLGVWPYISAAVLLSLIRAADILDSLKAKDLAGRNAVYKSARFVAAALALLQAAIVALGIERLPLSSDVETTLQGGLSFLGPAIVTLAAGALLALWLAEEITENGIGNGILLLLFIEVSSQFFGGFSRINGLLRGEEISLLAACGIVLTILLTIFAAVLVETAQRTTTVQYAKRVVGRMMMGGNQTKIPAKANPAGVLALIAAVTVAGWVTAVLSIDAFPLVYFPLFAALVIGFGWIYRKTLVDPREIAGQIQSSGGFIPGIRGDGIAGHFSNLLDRLSLGSAIVVAALALLPVLISRLSGDVLMLDELSLFLVSAVTFDFIGQVQSRHMVQNFGGSLPQPGGSGFAKKNRPSARRKKRR